MKWNENEPRSRRICSMSVFLFFFLLVPVPEEHPDVSQGVPRQVRSKEQRALWPLRTVWRQGLREGELMIRFITVFLLCALICEPNTLFQSLSIDPCISSISFILMRFIFWYKCTGDTESKHKAQLVMPALVYTSSSVRFRVFASFWLNTSGSAICTSVCRGISVSASTWDV